MGAGSFLAVWEPGILIASYWVQFIGWPPSLVLSFILLGLALDTIMNEWKGVSGLNSARRWLISLEGATAGRACEFISIQKVLCFVGASFVAVNPY